MARVSAHPAVRGGHAWIPSCAGMTRCGAARGSSWHIRAANKTLLASLPDLAVLLVLSTVVRLARIAALGFVSDSKPSCFNVTDYSPGPLRWVLLRRLAVFPAWPVAAHLAR